MNTINLKLYNILRQEMHLPEAKAQEFVQAIEEAIEPGKYNLATKQDISDLRGDLKVEIKESKVDTMKWMFGIFVALMLAIVGLYFKK